MTLDLRPIKISEEFRKTLEPWQLEILNYFNSKFEAKKEKKDVSLGDIEKNRLDIT